MKRADEIRQYLEDQRPPNESLPVNEETRTRALIAMSNTLVVIAELLIDIREELNIKNILKKKTNKQPEMLITVPVREVYIHKYVGKIQAVDVAVFIDYNAGIISLVDNPKQVGVLSPKKWVFADRTIEYMAGWCDILDAMKDAVLAAKGRLAIYQKERELEQAMMMQKVAEAINK